MLTTFREMCLLVHKQRAVLSITKAFVLFVLKQFEFCLFLITTLGGLGAPPPLPLCKMIMGMGVSVG